MSGTGTPEPAENGLERQPDGINAYPVTIPERLDAAQNGAEFGAVLSSWMNALGEARDE